MVYTLKSIDHVQLAAPVGSENEARAFFQDILYFNEVEKPPALKENGGVWFQNGSIQLHIGIDPDFVPAKKAHPALEVKDLSSFKVHLQNHGVVYKEDQKLPGANRLYISDPFGNRIEILEWI